MWHIFSKIKAMFAPRVNLTEGDRVRAALERHRQRILDMDTQWRDSGAPCCPGCLHGPQYYEALAKAERVEAWLAVLEAKQRRR